MDQQQTDEEEVVELVPMRILIALTMAMGLHHRLGGASVLHRLDGSMMCMIVGHAVPRFSEMPFWRFCQEIMLRNARLNLKYELDGDIFSITFQEPRSYIRVCRCGDDDNSSHESEISEIGEIGDTAEIGGGVGSSDETVYFAMKHPSFHAFMHRPDEPTFSDCGRDMLGITLHDPRDAENVVDGIQFLMSEGLNACYNSKAYHLNTDLGVENTEALEVLDIAINIAMFHITDGPICPMCGAAMGEGGMTDALCIACERQRLERDPRCPGCGAIMGEGGMPDALCTACERADAD